MILNLKAEWFEKIKSGEKIHEFREAKPYWVRRLTSFAVKSKTNRFIEFRKGYPKKGEDTFWIQCKSITLINGKDTDLKINKPVYDIELDYKTLTFNKEEAY